MQILEFQPILKRIRWGGRRLGTLLGKPIGNEDDYAESWEIADHGADQSIVLDGEFAGWPLHRLVVEKGPELFGRYHPQTQFPLLVKFLDATDRLSVQVHPNDEQARRLGSRENGKTEAWVILDAEPKSVLYAGLKADVDRQRLEQSLAAGTVEECLHSFPVSPGDCVFIPAGTVHAIGEGILLAEIQQSSDLTFRLYDWGRVGADGQPRELHIQQALDCIDFARGPVKPTVPQRVSTDEYLVEELVECPFFVIRRHTASKRFRVESDDRFRILMGLSGCAELCRENDRRELSRGRTVLVPAASASVETVSQPDVLFLEVFLP